MSLADPRVSGCVSTAVFRVPGTRVATGVCLCTTSSCSALAFRFVTPVAFQDAVAGLLTPPLLPDQVVPVALRAYVPFFPIEPGVLGVTLWKEFVWLLCYPVLVWELTFLPPQTKGKQESDADFARRVQVMTGELSQSHARACIRCMSAPVWLDSIKSRCCAAAELGSHVSPTSYLNKDALRLRLALLRDPPLRAKLLNGQFDVRWEEESKAS